MTTHANLSSLHRIVTDDEKWVLGVIRQRKRQWLLQDEKPITKPKTRTPFRVVLALLLMEHENYRPLLAA